MHYDVMHTMKYITLYFIYIIIEPEWLSNMLRVGTYDETKAQINRDFVVAMKLQ